MPMQFPSESTTGAPVMLDLTSKWPASRSSMSWGMLVTGADIRSAAVKARKVFIARRLVIRMACLLRLDISVNKLIEF